MQTTDSRGCAAGSRHCSTTPRWRPDALAVQVLGQLCAEFDAETANFANYNFDAEGGAVVGAYSWPVDQPLLPRYLAFENLAASDPRRVAGDAAAEPAALPDAAGR